MRRKIGSFQVNIEFLTIINYKSLDYIITIHGADLKRSDLLHATAFEQSATVKSRIDKIAIIQFRIIEYPLPVTLIRHLKRYLPYRHPKALKNNKCGLKI